MINDVTQYLATECGGKTLDSVMHSDSKYIYPFNCGVIDIPFGGGIHSGKIYEVFGEESNGKTTLTLEMTKAITGYYDSIGDDNYSVLWIESESALDRRRALHMGCRLDKFVFEEAETVEEARDFMISYLERCIEKNIKLLISWDTLASASTNNEMKAVMSSNSKDKFAAGMMEKPRLVSEMLRTVTNLLGKTNSTLILVNQVRMKPGQFASTLEPPGGKGVRFHTSVRSFIKKVGEVYAVLPNKEKRMIAIESEIFHVKNKLTSPKQSSTVYINTESGIDKLETTIRHLKGANDSPIKTKGGGHFSFLMPEGVSEKDGDEILVKGMIEISFQQVGKLRGLMDTYPHLSDWLDYLVYNNYSKSTTLVKIMIIKKLWEYEEKFFGKRVTALTEEEQKLYNSGPEMDSDEKGQKLRNSKLKVGPDDKEQKQTKAKKTNSKKSKPKDKD